MAGAIYTWIQSHSGRQTHWAVIEGTSALLMATLHHGGPNVIVWYGVLEEYRREF